MSIVNTVLCTVMLSVAMVTAQGPSNVSMERNLTRTVVKEICAGHSRAQLRTLYARFHQEYNLEVPLEGLFQRLTLTTPMTGDSVQFAPSSTCADATQADITWCLRLASASINTTTCLHPGGGVIASRAGSLLRLDRNMAVEVESGSLVIMNVSKLYAYAFVSAISRKDGCTSVAHTFIYLQNKRNITPTLMEFPPTNTKVAAGQGVAVNCTYSTSSGYYYLHWYKDGKDIPLILENPHCKDLNGTCKTDVRYPKDHHKRKSNVRSYTFSQRFCLKDSVHRHAVLVLDQAKLDDAGRYTCKLFGLSSREPLQSATFTLQVE